MYHLGDIPYLFWSLCYYMGNYALFTEQNFLFECEAISMNFAPIIIIILFMMISACQKSDAKSIEIDSSVKQVLFFSNETEHGNLQMEAPYYDAIIELRQRFPEEFSEIKTFAPTTDKDIFTKLEVQDCPAIIILHNDEVLAQVAGESSKEEILQPIEAALTN